MVTLIVNHALPWFEVPTSLRGFGHEFQRSDFPILVKCLNPDMLKGLELDFFAGLDSTIAGRHLGPRGYESPRSGLLRRVTGVIVTLTSRTKYP